MLKTVFQIRTPAKKALKTVSAARKSIFEIFLQEQGQFSYLCSKNTKDNFWGPIK